MDKKIRLIVGVDDVFANLYLKEGRRLIGYERLTISQNIDKLLIVTIDNLLAKNRIDRLSLKTMEIQGNIKLGAVSSMIFRTVKSGLGG